MDHLAQGFQVWSRPLNRTRTPPVMQGTFKRSRCSQPHAHLCLSLLLARLLPAPATPRPGLTRCCPRALAPPADPAPPPHLQREAAALHPRLAYRHQATCAPRRSPSVRPDAPRRQRTQKRTSRLLKPAKHTRALHNGTTEGQGVGHAKIKTRRRSCPSYQNVSPCASTYDV